MARNREPFKWVTILILVMFVNLSIGCTSTNLVLKERTELDLSNHEVLKLLSKNKISMIERGDSVKLSFDDDGGRYLASYGDADSVIVGKTIDGVSSVTKLSQVNSVWIQEENFNFWKTYLLVNGILFIPIIVLVIAVGLDEDNK